MSVGKFKAMSIFVEDNFCGALHKCSPALLLAMFCYRTELEQTHLRKKNICNFQLDNQVGLQRQRETEISESQVNIRTQKNKQGLLNVMENRHSQII